MGLYRRGNVWWVAYSTPAGRVVQSTGTTNKKDAETIYYELKRRSLAQRHGVVLQNPKLRFADVAATFLRQTGGCRHHVERLHHLLPVFGDLPIGSISRGLVEGYRVERLEKVKAATVNRDVAALRRILYWAMDEGIIGANPLTRFRRLPEPRKPRRVLSLADEEKLLEVASEHLRRAIVLSIDTGMRRGEILSLRREHLDAQRRVLVVSKSKTEGGAGREIPWTKRIDCLLRPLAGSEGLVVQYRGEPILTGLKRSWRGALKRSGIPRLRFHDLRHTFNTRLMEAGVSQDIRKALMGHADSDINDVYTHVELPAKRVAITQLERWLTRQRLELEQQHQDQPQPESEGGTTDGTLATANPEGNAGGTERPPGETH